MVTACWSVKGGTGTTVVAAALATLLARRAPAGALVVDLAGDLPAVLGLPPAGSPGLAGWLAVAPDVLPDALGRLEVEGSPRLAVLPRGTGALSVQGAALLSAVLHRDAREVVVDCGRLTAPTEGPSGGDIEEPVASRLVTEADRSLLVLRPCFLALQRAHAARHRPSGIVLVAEDGRAITRRDVEAGLGVPVVATVRVTDAVARAVDAGLLGTTLPRSIARDLHHVA